MLRTIDLINFLKTVVPFTYFANDFPKDAPTTCAFVRLNSGSPPSGWTVLHPSFQVVVRSQPKMDGDAESIAISLLEQLDRKTEFSIASHRIVICEVEQSAPFYIGEDDNHRPMYSVNFELTMQK
ncbi:minor capsid protein [Cohnella yongneupensis]|uniref:Minor capsid protein n=1 Tax=Cohnella yongneupensis TaxID=425006 RepID=A0ABW0QVM8_9BACL